MTPRGDEALFEFLDTGLSDSWPGEVRATDRFMRIKVRRRIPFHAGISLSEGLLSLELTSNDLSPDEILAAVSGYRLSQRYIRLKNGDFLRLEENEELRRLIELMDTLQVSPKELLSGRMHIPAFQSLYIDKMMESMEDVYAERDSRFKKRSRNSKRSPTLISMCPQNSGMSCANTRSSDTGGCAYSTPTDSEASWQTTWDWAKPCRP